MTTPPASHTELRAAQQEAFRANRVAPAADRVTRIQRVIGMLVACRDELVDAIDADFGGRHPGYSLTNDVMGTLAALNDAAAHVEEWMADSPRTVFAPYDQLGATSWVRYQPKGSVAIIGTWNAPLFTLLAPLAGVLAAGNRAVLKPSESVPRTAEVLTSWLAAHAEGTACVVGAPDLPDATRVRSLSPALAKGLEFDLVVVVAPEAFGDDVAGAVDRYVAMTRATRELVVLR